MAHDWSLVPLGRVVTRAEYGVSRAADADGDIPILGMQHIADGQVTAVPDQRVRLSDRERANLLLHEGDLLLNRTNSLKQVGKSAVVPSWLGECTFASYLVRLHVDRAKALPDFLVRVLNSAHGIASLRNLATPGVSQYNINPTALRRHFLIPLPPLREQEIVVQQLASWDVAVATLARLAAGKRAFKRGLMQELLTGKRRFKEFSGEEWKPWRLGQLLGESRVLSSDGRHARRLTVRLYGKGVVASEARRPGSERTSYYRRSAGQFVYSKLDFLNGACGVIPRDLDGFETTLDLPAFDVSPDLDARWLVATVSQPWFYRRHVGLAHGGRKARRVNPGGFLGIELNLPSKKEQGAVGDCLDLVDQEIRLLERLRDSLDRQRRGVAELLLTGKVRVPA